MRVAWITQGDLGYDDQGRPTSGLASARYRVIIPAQVMAERKVKSRVMQVAIETQKDEVDQRVLDWADVLVVSKSFNPLNESLAEDFRASGRPVVVDLCDDHFDRQAGEHHRRLLHLADRVVANTPAMARRIHQVSGREAAVVPDPYEGERQPPRFRPETGVLRLLWFGNAAQIETFYDTLPCLHRAFQGQCRLVVELVTNEWKNILPAVATYNQLNAPHIQIIYTPWDLGVTEAALARADAVFIPSGDENRFQVKSANRLLLSLWNGRYVVAWPLPEYRQFAQWAYVGKDLAAGLRWALDHPRTVEQGIRAAQDYIAARYAPERIGSMWYEVLTEVVSRYSTQKIGLAAPEKNASTHTQHDAQKMSQPFRLNLGCGDKILPGYVNVDVAPARAGQRPDLISDLHHLPLPDGCADEVLAVHVVEHFWRWEVVDVLKEWVRVLKPGGRLILECPNLKSACEAFLADPEKAAGPGPEGQRTMWVFYGDPRWQDPLMVHRWGYTPKSLAQVMCEAGLKGVRQAPAQFKLREPRDMRLVGEKTYA